MLVIFLTLNNNRMKIEKLVKTNRRVLNNMFVKKKYRKIETSEIPSKRLDD